jgi:hypothetical protein
VAYAGTNLAFSGFANLTGGSGDDAFQMTNGATLSGTVNGGAGANILDSSAYGSPVTVNLQTKTATGVGAWANFSVFVGTNTTDTLIGANTTNTWTLTGANAGTVNATSFSGFANLTGGTLNDTYKFSDQAGVTGQITDASGTNALDYSAYTTGVYVNLQTGAATGTGGVSGNLNVTGGKGNDILVGIGKNTLTDNAGMNILIGGNGAVTIGGTGANLLIAGTTVFDDNLAALDALMSVWGNSQLTYSQRVGELLSGVSYTNLGTTATAALIADETVLPPTGSTVSTLTGSMTQLDWFFAGAADTIKNRQKGEIISTL